MDKSQMDDKAQTLSECLTNLTKTEITAIRVNLKIKGASGLKKDALIAAVVEKIPDVLPSILLTFDETRYTIIKHIANRGGNASMPMEREHLQYFEERGLLFSDTYEGKSTFTIPREVLACFKQTDNASFREKIRRNNDWVKLTHGALFYYGTLSIGDLETVIELHMDNQVEFIDYLNVMGESAAFYQEMKLGIEGYSNYRVWDPSRVRMEHELRSELSLYPFTKRQLLQAGEPNFVDRNAAYKSLVDFIVKTYATPRNAADNLVQECVYAIQIGESTGHILQFLQQQLEIEELRLLQAFTEHLARLHNSTKQWFIKGYSPNELSAKRSKAIIPLTAPKSNVVDLFSKKEIGRNDPCPCGSGRKFKKCCGN